DKPTELVRCRTCHPRKRVWDSGSVTASVLVDAFAAGRETPIDAADRPVIGQALDAALTSARVAWPEITVDVHAWMSALGELAPTPLVAVHPLGDLEVADLYVAFAAGQRDTRALAACDALLVREAGYAATAARMDDASRDEAVQIVRAIV